MERVYKTMRNTGAGCIAIGIIIAVTGLTRWNYFHRKWSAAS
ncbi:MAG: hypothetical protein ACLTW9_26210 [Enterocloster sp.]